MNDQRCLDNKKDRVEGDKWERRFCSMYARNHESKFLTANQIKKSGAAKAVYWNGHRYSSVLLPDVTVWSAPGEHYELKNKRPTKRRFGENNSRCYGLEEYRYKALVDFAKETQQPVYYAIHDWEKAGGKEKPCTLIDWVYANILYLFEPVHQEKGASYYNGKEIKTNILYWPIEEFRPLAEIW